MSRAIECAFRSEHPEVLTAWEARCERAQSFHDTVVAFAHARGCEALVMSWGDGRRLSGLVAGTKDAPAGPWRYDRRNGCYVPDRRTAAGKALAEEVKAIRVDGLRDLPGMPDQAEGGPGREGVVILSPGIDLLGGAVWATWGCKSDAVANSKWARTRLDLTIWTEERVSAYYLARESAAEKQLVESNNQ